VNIEPDPITSPCLRESQAKPLPMAAPSTL
jgi:hypothetical protein